MGGSNFELQDLTNRLVDKATAYKMESAQKKSKTMTNNMNNINTDISMIGQKVEKVTSFKYLVQGLYLLSRSPHQNYVSNGSSGQTKQDLAVQHDQLRKQVQALQVTCHLHPSRWL